jgi:prophage maintenance system killer protein
MAGSSIGRAELDDLVEQLRAHPNGASMADLVGVDASAAKRSAVRTRLAHLIKTGRARREGARRWTRYFHRTDTAPETRPLRETPAHSADRATFDISEAGLAVRQYLARPKSARTSVGYNRAFLDAYEPNETHYLSTADRSALKAIGAAAAERQPAGTHARQILGRLLIDLSWNSSRLEGNTYSLLDTKLLIEAGKVADGKSAHETQMILNHKEAIEFLVEGADEIAFNRLTILNLHALLSNNLLPDPMASGRLRRRSVEIGGSVDEPPQDPHFLEECFNQVLYKAGKITDVFEQALFVTVHLPYLQPFEDVNKRVSRLAANIPFIKANLSPISFVDVPQDVYVETILAVYELNTTELAREMFMWAYERSARRYSARRQSTGEPDQFRLKYREELRSVVAGVIRAPHGKQTAPNAISEFAAGLPVEDRARFVEVAETEIIGLHEGNFARYKVRSSEYFAWRRVWESDRSD